MRVLCIGDIVGRPGREAVHGLLPALIKRERLDLVIANGENASGGMGLSAETARELLAAHIDVLTGGNHIWKFRDLLPVLEAEPRIVRPLNYPHAPGHGVTVVQAADGTPVGVINLSGRVFLDALLCPFATVEAALAELKQQAQVIIVEIHGEATSEKRALGWFLAGRVSAVFGTHTHVPTADAQVLPEGTGYISDVGMTGPYDSVIGMTKAEMIERLRSLRPATFIVAKDDVRLCGVIFDIDAESGKTRAVQRIEQAWPT